MRLLPTRESSGQASTPDLLVPLCDDVFHLLPDSLPAVHVDPRKGKLRVRTAKSHKGDLAVHQQQHARIVVFDAGEHESVHPTGIDQFVISIKVALIILVVGEAQQVISMGFGSHEHTLQKVVQNGVGLIIGGRGPGIANGERTLCAQAAGHVIGFVAQGIDRFPDALLGVFADLNLIINDFRDRLVTHASRRSNFFDRYMGFGHFSPISLCERSCERSHLL